MGKVSIMGKRKYPLELRERALRLYRQAEPKPVIAHLAEQLGRGIHREALRNWIRQDQADHGERDDLPTTAMLEENRRLARENAELKRVNEILRAASAYFAQEFDPTRRRCMRFIDAHPGLAAVEDDGCRPSSQLGQQCREVGGGFAAGRDEHHCWIALSLDPEVDTPTADIDHAAGRRVAAPVPGQAPRLVGGAGHAEPGRAGSRGSS
ncbi:transposase [Nonomuraea sp. NPDC048916]|uniref:transposase n=1 Tax=Nonomuraea sp. NPDC048916 TaxID=3154232 RepID=UPI00340F7E9C